MGRNGDASGESADRTMTPEETLELIRAKRDAFRAAAPARLSAFVSYALRKENAGALALLPWLSPGEAAAAVGGWLAKREEEAFEAGMAARETEARRRLAVPEPPAGSADRDSLAYRAAVEIAAARAAAQWMAAAHGAENRGG